MPQKPYFQREGEKAIYSRATNTAFKTEAEALKAGVTPYWQPGFTGESNVEMLPTQPTTKKQLDLGDRPMRDPSQTRSILEGLDVTSPTKQEETDIVQQEREVMQSRIDDIRRAADQAVKEEQQRGVEALGGLRARQARGGLLGSSFESQQRGKQKAETAGNVQGIRERAEAQINLLIDKAYERAQTRIASEKQEAIEGKKMYVELEGKLKTESREDWTLLAKSGADLQLLKETYPDVYTQFLKDTGYSQFQADFLYNDNKPDPIQYQWVWKGNNLVGIGTDPQTGAMVQTESYSAEDLGLPRDANPAFISNEQTGELFYYDKDNPVIDEETGAPKLFAMGKFSESAAEKMQRDITTYWSTTGSGKNEKSTIFNLPDMEGVEPGEQVDLSSVAGIKRVMELRPDTTYGELYTQMTETGGLSDSATKQLLGEAGVKSVSETKKYNAAFFTEAALKYVETIEKENEDKKTGKKPDVNEYIRKMHAAFPDLTADMLDRARQLYELNIK